MNLIDLWGARWNIPAEALEDFKSLFGVASENSHRGEGEAESMVSSVIRLEATKSGLRMWRNNVGACTDSYGNFIRYGLANDSTKLNKVVKSSDLIGIKPIKISASDVGRTIGQFTAREVKKSDWKLGKSAREAAQLNFLNIVNELGGDGQFVTGEGSFK